MEYDGTGERDFLKDIAITKTYEQHRYAQLMRAFQLAVDKNKTLEAQLGKMTSEPVTSELECAMAENAALRRRIADIERSAITLNADKMSFMREFLLLRAAKVESTHEMFSKTVHNAEATWNAIVAACEVKP